MDLVSNILFLIIWLSMEPDDDQCQFIQEIIMEYISILHQIITASTIRNHIIMVSMEYVSILHQTTASTIRNHIIMVSMEYFSILHQITASTIRNHIIMVSMEYFLTQMPPEMPITVSYHSSRMPPISDEQFQI